MIFKYKESDEVSGKKLYRPEIPIMFKYKNNFAILHGLIDSGADCVVLPLKVAEVLNIKLKNKKEFFAAGGNRKDGYENISGKTAVYFALNQESVLLGNRGFLENLKVILDGPKREVEIFGN